MSTLDKVREIIRAEVAKANAIEAARPSLERIILSSISWTETGGSLAITVQSEEGEPLLGRTVQDLITDLRSRRPTFFDEAMVHSDAAAVGSSVKELVAADGNAIHVFNPERSTPALMATVVDAGPTPAQRSRDWLLVGETFGSAFTSAELHMRVDEIQHHLRDRLLPSSDRNIVTEVPTLPDRGHPLRAFNDTIGAGGTKRRLYRRAALAALTGTMFLVLCSALFYRLLPSWNALDRHASPATTPQSIDLAGTGSIPSTRLPEPLRRGALRGVPEVIDTATLLISGTVAPLFGVEWVEGGAEPGELAGYLRGREVTCIPSMHNAKTFRCEVQGQDLSKVVLFNGGTRASPDATQDLVATEAYARRTRKGLWARSGP
jgi:hypothetical protein